MSLLFGEIRMKTFDKKDLITWSNRHNAKVGTIGYFANFINDLKDDIEHDKLRTLVDISDDCECCFDCYSSNNSDVFSYGFFLPEEAVKEERKYRPCETIREFYELVSNSKCKMDEKECIYQLISDFIINFRSRNTHTEYYTFIRSISKDENGDIKILITRRSYLSFEQIFNNYEIKINGEWLPFGVLEK